MNYRINQQAKYKMQEMTVDEQILWHEFLGSSGVKSGFEKWKKNKLVSISKQKQRAENHNINVYTMNGPTGIRTKSFF